MQWFFLSQFILKYMIFIHNHFILSITNNKKYRKKEEDKNAFIGRYPSGTFKLQCYQGSS